MLTHLTWNIDTKIVGFDQSFNTVSNGCELLQKIYVTDKVKDFVWRLLITRYPAVVAWCAYVRQIQVVVLRYTVDRIRHEVEILRGSE